MPFAEILSEIRRAHGSISYYQGDGGARSATLRETVGFGTINIWNNSAYGSRTTSGGRPATGNNPVRRIRLQLGLGCYYNINFNRAIPIAKTRQIPDGTLNRSLFVIKDYNTSLPVIQMSGRDVWLLFDIEEAVESERSFKDLYQILYGTLTGERLHHLPTTHDDFFSTLRTNESELDDLRRNSVTPSPRPPSPPPPPPQPREVDNYLVDQPTPLVQIPAQINETLITFILKQRSELLKLKLEERRKDLTKIKGEYADLMIALDEVVRNRDLAIAEIDCYEKYFS